MLPLILWTRPDPESAVSAKTAQDRCPAHEPIIAPLFGVAPAPYDPAVFEGAKGLILTSANAVPALPPLPPLKAWCVWRKTAAAARAAGFDAVAAGAEAGELIDALRSEHPEGPLVYAHGVHWSRDVVAALPELEIRSVAVYESRAKPFPPGLPDRLARAGRIFAPLYSPRAATELARQPGVVSLSGLVPVAISEACADALPRSLRARAIIAEAPNGDAVIAALAEAMSQDAPAA
ncbi:uroporphyrinogen-III synthase [Rhodobacter sp. NTK016B]|uniref:uroporphyrinogen-III synthase n=1 Tax=Rhodobacter sp. NTK016B TaxID=2759676 RepID=UPI001A8FE300|nr:uroporphyrinogen-III synthase [Rhodobacter sp. NTK016B]MBN8293535.1 uroporphyrinogen-III synthase [Rhodobacter sp. NTK016B]